MIDLKGYWLMRIEIIGAESLPIPVARKEDLTFRQQVQRSLQKTLP